MKKYLKILVLALAASFTMTGCNEWLDLKPESEIILDEYWQTEADVDGVLASCYKRMTESDVIYRMIAWGELRSDNMVAGSGISSARYDLKRILDGDITATNNYASWSAYYSVINYCNNLLHFAPQVVDVDMNFSVADLDRVKAEALTIRALAYFYLVRAFHEVPFFTEPIIDDQDPYNVAKSSEDIILDQLESDLLYAGTVARETYGANNAYNKGRVTKSSVYALLADIYLWRNKYQLCSFACSMVMQDKKLQLVNKELFYQKVFYLGNSEESIFELQFDENQITNTAAQNLYGTYGDDLGELSFPVSLAYNPNTSLLGADSPFAFKVGTATESTTDIRALQSYVQTAGKFFIFKYAGITAPTTLGENPIYFYRRNTPNWIVYRLSDVILMKAEAEAQMYNDTIASSDFHRQAALTLVNKTYYRSNSDSLSHDLYSSNMSLNDLVLRERQRELLFEGKRWFDLMRLARREGSTSSMNSYVEVKEQNGNGMLGAKVLDAMYMPIYQRELDANPLLEQNPFYQETTSSSTR